MTLSRVILLKFSLMVSTDSMLHVPGYSANRRPDTPSDLPVLTTRGRKVVAATVTEGIPSFSAIAAGRAAAGVQVPQAPLPVITASQAFFRIAFFTAPNTFSIVAGPNEAMEVKGNSV